MGNKFFVFGFFNVANWDIKRHSRKHPRSSDHKDRIRYMYILLNHKFTFLLRYHLNCGVSAVNGLTHKVSDSHAGNPGSRLRRGNKFHVC